MTELKILTHIGHHLNVVNLLGACTKQGGKEEGSVPDWAPLREAISSIQLLPTDYRSSEGHLSLSLSQDDLGGSVTRTKEHM